MIRDEARDSVIEFFFVVGALALLILIAAHVVSGGSKETNCSCQGEDDCHSVVFDVDGTGRRATCALRDDAPACCVAMADAV